MSIVSVCGGFNRCRRVQCMMRAVCTGSFGAAFVKLLRLLVSILVCIFLLLLFVSYAVNLYFMLLTRAETLGRQIERTVSG